MTKSLVMPPPHPPTLMVVPPLSHRDSKKFVSWSGSIILLLLVAIKKVNVKYPNDLKC